MKKLIHFDEIKYLQKMQDVESAAKLCNTYVSEFETLGAGRITESTWQLMKGCKFDELKREVAKGVKKQLEKAGITVVKFIQNSVDEAIEDFETLSSIWNFNLSHRDNVFALRFLQMDNGKIVFTESERARLKEQFETYIETKSAGMELLELQGKVAKDLQELAERIGIGVWQLPAALFTRVFRIEGENILPEVLNYDLAKKVA